MCALRLKYNRLQMACSGFLTLARPMPRQTGNRGSPWVPLSLCFPWQNHGFQLPWKTTARRGLYLMEKPWLIACTSKANLSHISGHEDGFGALGSRGSGLKPELAIKLACSPRKSRCVRKNKNRGLERFEIGFPGGGTTVFHRGLPRLLMGLHGVETTAKSGFEHIKKGPETRFLEESGPKSLSTHETAVFDAPLRR